MFTPEFVSEQDGTVLLVANHCLETPEAVALSTGFQRARIVAGRRHIPPSLQTWRVIYDARGQNLPDSSIVQIRASLADLCDLEFKR